MKKIIELTPIIIIWTATIAMTAGAFCSVASAGDHAGSKVAVAVFRMGGHKTTYSYGLRSAGYKNEADSRRTCLNALYNNRKRYTKHGHRRYGTYIGFSQSRYRISR